ncbi:MAG: aldehyde dehydrogenase PuuC, partial [Rhizobiales bacterium 24-66-13]
MSASTLAAAAAAPSFRTDAFINGRFVPAASGKRFTAINPATGQELGQIAACDGIDVDRAVSAARMAFEDRRWAGLKPGERKRILVRFADLVRTHRDEL